MAALVARSLPLLRRCLQVALVAALVNLIASQDDPAEPPPIDEEVEVEGFQQELEDKSHITDSGMLLMVMGLLVVTVFTTWLFKVKRFRFIHETGVCMLYGIVIGFIIKYTGGVHKAAKILQCGLGNFTDQPFQNIWVKIGEQYYSYSYSGPVNEVNSTGKQDALEEKAVFDPEIFFYVLLPPIIFHAGYDMKKRFFFRNIGAILAFAFIGTTISCVVVGGMMYLYTMFGNIDKDFDFVECLLFGALISATDPVTVLAVFHDLHVDVDLYALVFGESVMNDAVAIVLYRSVESYLAYNRTSAFHAQHFFEAVGVFIGVFGGSFALGLLMGLITALLMKLTKIGEFPLLETALFFVMSWATFLLAEVCELTGIVAVLFCGITQAHYTYNNLSDDSKQWTKQTFALLNFLAESFIFSYMGLSLFTFQKHQWDVGFILWSFLAIALGRMCNIYPLSFILNIGRGSKISYSIQNMMMFSGLRGAVAYALAIRNTASVPRQLMLTTVLVIVLVTVIVCGGATMSVLTYLKIRVGVNAEEEEPRFVSVRTDPGEVRTNKYYEKAWIFRVWYDIDKKFMKPLFTNHGPPMTEIMPEWCGPLARCLSGPNHRESQEEANNGDDNVSIEGQLTFQDDIMLVRPDGGSSATNPMAGINETEMQDAGDLGLGPSQPARV